MQKNERESLFLFPFQEKFRFQEEGAFTDDLLPDFQSFCDFDPIRRRFPRLDVDSCESRIPLIDEYKLLIVMLHDRFRMDGDRFARFSHR